MVHSNPLLGGVGKAGHTFPNGISLKVKVVRQLDFALCYSCIVTKPSIRDSLNNRYMWKKKQTESVT